MQGKMLTTRQSESCTVPSAPATAQQICHDINQKQILLIMIVVM